MPESVTYCVAWAGLAMSIFDALKLLSLRRRLPTFQRSTATLLSASAAAENPTPNTGIATADRFLSSKSVLFANYQYSFQGKQHKGCTIYPDELSWLVLPGRFKHPVKKTIRLAIQKDRQVTVFINPRHPREAFLSTEFASWTLALDLFIVFMCILGLAFTVPSIEFSSPLGVVAALASSAIGIASGPWLRRTQIKGYHDRAVEL